MLRVKRVAGIAALEELTPEWEALESELAPRTPSIVLSESVG
jgi:hypothetical protein